MTTLAGSRVVVVGASSGVGRAVAHRAIAGGAEVVAVARRARLLDELIAEAGGGSAVAADICDEEQCVAAMDRAVDLLGGIDLLVVATAVSGLQLLVDADGDSWERMFRTNVVGVNQLIRAAVPRMSPGGLVAVLSSEDARQPRRGLAPTPPARRRWRARWPRGDWNVPRSGSPASPSAPPCPPE